MSFLDRSSNKRGDFLFFGILIFIIGGNIIWTFSTGGYKDFGSFYASGIAIAEGGNPYDADFPLVNVVRIPGLDIEVKNPNLNPPITLLVFDVIANLEINFAYRLWQIITILLYILAVGLLILIFQRNHSLIFFAWIFCLAGFWHTVELGQIYTLLLLLSVISWGLLLAKKYYLAGLFIGIIIAVKPNFVIWPLLMIFAGGWSVALTSILSAGLLSIIPLLHYGAGIYSQWLNATMNYSGLMMPSNNSIIGLFARLGLTEIGYIISIFLLIFLVFLIRIKKISVWKTSELGVIATLLASPITWTGYTIMVLPILFHPKRNRYHRIAGIILSVPIALVLILSITSKISYVIIGGFYMWALLLILGTIISEMSEDT